MGAQGHTNRPLLSLKEAGFLDFTIQRMPLLLSGLPSSYKTVSNTRLFSISTHIPTTSQSNMQLPPTVIVDSADSEASIPNSSLSELIHSHPNRGQVQGPLGVVSELRSAERIMVINLYMHQSHPANHMMHISEDRRLESNTHGRNRGTSAREEGIGEY